MENQLVGLIIVAKSQKIQRRGEQNVLQLQAVLVATAEPLSRLISCLILLLHISWFEHFNAFLLIALHPLPTLSVKLSKLVVLSYFAVYRPVTSP